MPLILILATFALYRLATDLAWMDGPFKLYAALRGFAMVHFPKWVGDGLTCPICISFWIALPIGFAIDPAMGFVYWFAIAGAVAFLARFTSDD